ncbi:hypothetical protein BH10ACT7_BH10ACT7_03320 [soil metagenome]
MSDTTLHPGFGESPIDQESEIHAPKHRLEGVPVDAPSSSSDPLLSEFGENPDTSLTG